MAIDRFREHARPGRNGSGAPCCRSWCRDMVSTTSLLFNAIPETNMLYNHHFPEPASKRSPGFIGRNWLPLAVVTVAVGLLVAGLLGVSTHKIWIGSTMLSGFVLSYTIFVLVRSRRRLYRLNRRLGAALSNASVNKSSDRRNRER